MAEEEGAASAEEGAAADVRSLFLLLSRYLHLQIHKIHQNSPSGIFPDGGFLFCPFRQDWSPSQRVGSRSPIPALTGMLEDSTPTPPKGEGRRVSSRQTRYLLIHQRKYPKSVSRGRTPWIPPSQLKCTDSFPSATYDGVRDSSDGLRPGADRVTEASCTQLGAWLRTALRADAGNGGKAPQ